MPLFKGLKISPSFEVARKFPDVHLVSLSINVNRMQFGTPGKLGWGGNSGFHALNLAAQFGARRIVLVGFDMTLARGTHWHGRHAQGLNNPSEESVLKWRTHLDAAAPSLAEQGISVVNASTASALAAYPKMPLEQALEAIR